VGGHLAGGISAKDPYGYTVDPKATSSAFQELVQENDAAALTELHLDATHLEELAIDLAANHSEPKYLG
jgi:hypothetical protein